MEKTSRFIPMGMLTVYLVKCLILGPNFVDAAILTAFCCLVGYFQYRTEEKEISSMKKQLNEMQTDIDAAKKRGEELSSHVNSMKLGLNMRSSGFGSNKQG